MKQPEYQGSGWALHNSDCIEGMWAIVCQAGGNNAAQVGSQPGRCHATGHLAGVVSTHAIGKHGKARLGVGHDGVFVVGANHAWIATRNHLENGIHIHGDALRN